MEYCKGKIIVMFKNIGNAPQLKQKKFKLSTKVKFQYVIDFLRKQVKSLLLASVLLFFTLSLV
jgi:hypothetical protein